jgi:hypothetical protein
MTRSHLRIGGSPASSHSVGGPWLCVPPLRVVCPWHLSDSGTGGIDTPNPQPDGFRHLSDQRLGQIRCGKRAWVLRPLLLRVTAPLKLPRAPAPRTRDLMRLPAEARDQLAGAAARRARRAGIVCCGAHAFHDTRACRTLPSACEPQVGRYIRSGVLAQTTCGPRPRTGCARAAGRMRGLLNRVIDREQRQVHRDHDHPDDAADDDDHHRLHDRGQRLDGGLDL